ncbi:MAG: serine/threonine-protein kinase, partial [bacterium]
MDEAQRFKILSELFDRARDLARPELDAFLSEINDAALRDEVASMVALDREGTVGVGTIIDIASVLEEEPGEPEVAIPDRIGHYEVLGLVGTGASGVVLRARQPETDRIVAIKVLGVGSWNPRALARFRREIRLLGRLDHPNIARIYEAGAEGDGLPTRPYFVMEFVSGPTLVAWSRALAEGGAPMSTRLPRILDIFEQVVLAVGYAHANGVVHRDLKPANILVGSNGRAKVLDFGVSGFLPETSASAHDDTRIDTPTQSLPGHALTEQLVGTVPYMSPEQV